MATFLTKTKKVKQKLTSSADKNICLIPGQFIPDYKELKSVVDAYKKEGKRIILTQGVYDLLHVGHALYLSGARLLGDVLIVGVDSDELTRARKGPRRPVVPEEERVAMLLHLRHVDIVTMRHLHHDTNDILRVVRPDVLVVSESTADFTAEKRKACLEFCKQVVRMPPQATTSSTNRMRQLAIDGAEELATEVERLTHSFLERIRKA